MKLLDSRLGALLVIAFAALWLLVSNPPLAALVAVAGLAVVARLAIHAERAPERVIGLTATAAVVSMAVFAVAQILWAIAEHRILFSGALSGDDVHRFFGPHAGDAPVPGLPEYGRAISAETVMTVPNPPLSLFLCWAMLQHAPWLLAAALRLHLNPLLRRGAETTAGDNARRLHNAGVLLLISLPALSVLHFALAEAETSAVNFAEVLPGPVLNTSPVLLLPGLALLALAAVVRQRQSSPSGAHVSV